MVKPGRLEKTGSKLRARTLDHNICLNLDNYEKILLKIKNHFTDMSIKDRNYIASSIRI